MPKVVVALSFEGVITKLQNPRDAVERIKKWAGYVGIASNKPQHRVVGFCTKHGVDIDFFPSPKGGMMDSLRKAREEMDMDGDRYLFVGASRRDEVVADKAGWEYMGFDEMIENVGWAVKD